VDPRVSDEKNEDIGKCLTDIFQMLGITPDRFPDGVNLIGYVRGNLQRYSLEDIRVAFTMYIQNRLDREIPFYGEFSMMFLEAVMQSYARYIINTKVEEEKAEDYIQMSEEERMAQAREIVITSYIRFTVGKEFIDMGTCPIYEYLKKRGVLPDFSEEMMTQFRKNATETVTAENSMGRRLSSVIKSGLFQDSVETSVKNQMVKAFFKMIQENQEDITDYV